MVPHPCGARVGDGSTKTLRRLPCPSPTLRLRRRMGHPRRFRQISLGTLGGTCYSDPFKVQHSANDKEGSAMRPIGSCSSMGVRYAFGVLLVASFVSTPAAPTAAQTTRPAGDGAPSLRSKGGGRIDQVSLSAAFSIPHPSSQAKDGAPTRPPSAVDHVPEGLSPSDWSAIRAVYEANRRPALGAVADGAPSLRSKGGGRIDQDSSSAALSIPHPSPAAKDGAPTRTALGAVADGAPSLRSKGGGRIDQDSSSAALSIPHPSPAAKDGAPTQIPADFPWHAWGNLL